MKAREIFKTNCTVCGKERTVKFDKRLSGRCQSCATTENRKARLWCNRGTLSGEAHTRLYTIWKGMRLRCSSPATESYEHYGALGITVCDEWKNDFLEFKRWSEVNNYDDSLTIDRIDGKGNYEPSNCRWVTDIEQARNKSSVKLKKEQIPCIVTMFRIGMKDSQIAKLYNVGREAINKVRNGKRWSDISGITPRSSVAS
jgi:hypothetical protein